MGRHEQREQVFILLFQAEFHKPEEMPRQMRLYLDGNEEIESLQDRITGRFSCETIKDKDGNVIVTKMTSSEMLPYMRRASAVVVESTNPECHAAVACQAMGIPLMMDRSYQAVHMLKSGMMITVDANEGFIYNGIKA